MTESQLPNNTPENETLAKFQEWAETIRDPANQTTEGIRRLITANQKATAEYEIAPLTDGRFAVRWRLSYHSGNMSGRSSPWSPHPNRQACVDTFLTAAQHHFGTKIREHKIKDSQQEARIQMLNLLKGNLFGFIESEPELSSDTAPQQ